MSVKLEQREEQKVVTDGLTFVRGKKESVVKRKTKNTKGTALV